MTRKITLRIPTKEQYAFVELNLEDIEAEEAKELYDQWTYSFNNDGAGLPTKEWNFALDGYVKGGSMTVDMYDRMSYMQKLLIQELKKSVKRLETKK